jgi:flagellar basal body-associated protein FliL
MKTFKLENQPKIESGFKTPENYFENFSAKIMQQLPENEPKVISLFQKRKIILMAVAAILVVAMMIPIYTLFSTNSKELDESTLENYITYQSSMNQYDLISELEAEDINRIKTTIPLEDETIEDILTTNSDTERLILE